MAAVVSRDIESYPVATFPGSELITAHLGSGWLKWAVMKAKFASIIARLEMSTASALASGLAIAVAVSLPGQHCVAASASPLRFAGIEFYGSSLLSNLELHRDLGIKRGATLEATARAVEQLRRRLELRHLHAQLQIVQVPPAEVYVVVDLPDSVTDASAPTRRLKNPHHVAVTSEKPFLLMDKLDWRLEKLSVEGRPWSETLREGIKYYTDEPANIIVEDILKQVPDMVHELLAVVASDPDPNRRRRAVELLHWAGSTPNVCLSLIPAIDDADSGVRASVARYMFPRFEMLPDDFPFDQLVEAYGRMLSRPSHQDRTKSLFCLLAIAGQRPELTPNIKVFSEDRVKKLSELSVIPSVRGPAGELMTKFMSMPPPRPPAPDREEPAQSGGLF